MTVGNLSMSTVELLADEVKNIISSFVRHEMSDTDVEQVERGTEFLGPER